jgi:hypothetical protein
MKSTSRLFESTPLKLLMLPAIPLAVLGIVALASHSSPPPAPTEHVIRCVFEKTSPPPPPLPKPAPEHVRMPPPA